MDPELGLIYQPNVFHKILDKTTGNHCDIMLLAERRNKKTNKYNFIIILLFDNLCPDNAYQMDNKMPL